MSAFSFLRRRLSRRRSPLPISFTGPLLLMGKQKKGKKDSPPKRSSPVPRNMVPPLSPFDASISPAFPAEAGSADPLCIAQVYAQSTVSKTDLAIVTSISLDPVPSPFLKSEVKSKVVPSTTASVSPIIGAESGHSDSTPRENENLEKAPTGASPETPLASSPKKNDSWVSHVKGTFKELKKKGSPFTLPSGEVCI